MYIDQLHFLNSVMNKDILEMVHCVREIVIMIHFLMFVYLVIHLHVQWYVVNPHFVVNFHHVTFYLGCLSFCYW